MPYSVLCTAQFTILNYKSACHIFFLDSHWISTYQNFFLNNPFTLGLKKKKNLIHLKIDSLMDLYRYWYLDKLNPFFFFHTSNWRVVIYIKLNFMLFSIHYFEQRKQVISKTKAQQVHTLIGGYFTGSITLNYYAIKSRGGLKVSLSPIR